MNRRWRVCAGSDAGAMQSGRTRYRELAVACRTDMQRTTDADSVQSAEERSSSDVEAIMKGKRRRSTCGPNQSIRGVF